MKILDEQTIQQYIENNPESLHFSILADKLLAKGDIENAEEISRIGLALHQEDAEGYFILAKILLSQNKLAEGLKQLQNVIKYQPGFIAAHKLLLLYGKEDLSLKEIDNSHKIVEAFEKNICKTPEVTLSFDQPTSMEEPFLMAEDSNTDQDTELETEFDLELDDFEEEEIEETFLPEDNESENDEELDLDAFEEEPEVQEEEVFEEDNSLDFELDIPVDEDESSEKEISEEESISKEIIEEKVVEAEIDDEIADLDIPEETPGEEISMNEEPDEQSDDSTFELEINDKDEDTIIDDNTFFPSSNDESAESEEEFDISKFELDIEIEDEMHSILARNTNDEFDPDDYPETSTNLMSNFSFDDEPEFSKPVVEEASDEELSELSILPVENFEEEQPESEEENTKSNNNDPEEIPEFKSTLNKNLDDEPKESPKEKVNLNIPIPTLTFVEVLKKQKLYDQALEILEILEERSSDKDKIIQQKEEIIRLKVEDNY